MPKGKVPVDPVVAELADIKKLLIGLLMQSGATQDVVAKVLGIDRSNVSRMFPSGLAGEITKTGSRAANQKGGRNDG